MFGTSGVRGPIGREVTAETALSIGRAVATTGAAQVVVGRDVRDTGRMLVDALAAGVVECGGDVVDLGVVSTPTVARSVPRTGADVGVVVTASHNPPADNGIKLWTSEGRAFGTEHRSEIESVVLDGAYDFADWDGNGTRRTSGVAEREHTDQLVATFDGQVDCSVVVDVGNGTGGLTADVLDRVGCEVQTLNARPDGSFPGRPSEPTAANCSTLRKVVAATDADIGIAHDGDADRMRAADANGEFVGGDALLALFAREAIDEGGAVTAPLNTSLAVDRALEERGGEVVRTPVGDVHVAEKAAEIGAAFGGEPSGAWIWPAETPCPDGPLAACELVRLVAERGPLDTLVDELPSYPIRRDAIEVDGPTDLMVSVTETLLERYADVSTLDGVRVATDDGWFLVRASGTQPLIRLTAEATTAVEADRLLERARNVVEERLADE